MLNCFIRHRMADKQIDDITQLMELSGLSRNSINKLFHTKNIATVKLSTLIKLCDTFGCKLSDLMEYTPEGDQAK